VASKAAPSNAIALKPGDNIAEIVRNAPAGATFNLQPGLYRLQSAQPKDRQRFIANGNVVFNGAVVLADWRRQNGVWTAVGPESRRYQSGFCNKETPLCTHREDLFVDGALYKKVASLEELAPGKWYDDGVKVHISDDPTRKQVELSVMPFAFSSEAEGVVLQGIVIEKYASEAQYGAIEIPKSRGWELKNVVARWNHGLGVRVGPGTRISGGSYSHNGQMGMGGGFGTGIVIENVEIAYNNYAGFDAGWEAGGTKFVGADGLVVRNSCVHNNDGPGLWTDIDNINIVFADNFVFENRGDGIKHEISYSAKIYGNTVARNGHEDLNWLWGSQILIQNSPDAEVFGNTVEVGSAYGNGISVIHQDRGAGRHGPWASKNTYVHQNTIIHLAANGMNGMIADFEKEWFDNDAANRFERNRYVVPSNDKPYFVVKGRGISFAELPQFGVEKGMTVEVATRQPLKLRCPR
jgi:hypothetical protein